MKRWNMDLQSGRVKRQIQLNEWREKAYTAPSSTRNGKKRWHDKRIKIKHFKVGDEVLLFNTRFHLFGHGKLRSK
jgi:hypothetical protein